MLGVLVGAGLAVMFMKLYAHRRGWPAFASAGSCGSRGFGRWGRHHHRHGGEEPFGGGGRDGDGWASRKSRWAARWLFQRLRTSPGQEKVILEAWDAVTEKGSRLKDEWRRARSDVARAVRGATLDEAALKEAQARQDTVLAEVRETLHRELARVHEALDERQRRDLADLMELGPRGSGREERW